jgi:xanthosine utilization system XapX-like protein
MPPVYLLAMPWAIRGIEEARVYVVLVGQSVLWLLPFFLFYFDAPAPPLKTGWGLFGDLLGIGILVLWYLIMVWGALAMVRGWREHRDFRRLLGALP